MAKKKRQYTKSRALSIVNKFFPKVKLVVDATEPLTVEVTKSDVKTSARSDHAGCAAAVACKRKLHLDAVIMSRAIAYLIKGTTATRYEVPDSLTREVVAFDRGGDFEPGTYRLKAVYEGVALGAVQRTERAPSKSTGKAPTRHVTTHIRAALGGVPRGTA